MLDESSDEETDFSEFELPPPVVDLIASALRRRIATRRIMPGPVKISSLAKTFKVSPSPVREALRRLEAEGLVLFTRNQGVLVNSLSLCGLREIFEMRLLLEPLLLGHAVPALTGNAAAREELDGYLKQMGSAFEDTNRWRDANSAFHLGMYKYAETRYLRKIVLSLWTAVEPYLRIYVTESNVLHAAQQEHLELLQLVFGGESGKASELLRKHLAQTWDVIERRLSA